MGYYLQAIIGSVETFQSHASKYENAVVVPIGCNLALIPLSDELFDEVGESGYVGGFDRLTPELEAWLLEISGTSVVAYIEAEYFGGIGDQISIVWSLNKRLSEPLKGKNAINKALHLLGVSAGSSFDEFEAVGLNKHRNIDGWLGRDL